MPSSFLDAYDPRVGTGIEGSNLDAEVDGAGKMDTSSAWAVPRSLRDLPSIDVAPNSEFSEVHHSPPESFCISAYLRPRMGSCDGSEEFNRDGDFDFDLAPGLVSALSSTAASCMNGSILSRSSGIETEWNDAWSSRDRARLQKESCWAAGVEGRARGWDDIGKRCFTADYFGGQGVSLIREMEAVVDSRVGHIEDAERALPRGYGMNRIVVENLTLL